MRHDDSSAANSWVSPVARARAFLAFVASQGAVTKSKKGPASPDAPPSMRLKVARRLARLSFTIVTALDPLKTPLNVYRWVADGTDPDAQRRRMEVVVHLRRNVERVWNGWPRERQLAAALRVWEQAIDDARRRGLPQPRAAGVPLSAYTSAVKAAPRRSRPRHEESVASAAPESRVPCRCARYEESVALSAPAPLPPAPKSRVQCRCARYEESVALPAPATLPPASESRVQRRCARYEEPVALPAPAPLPPAPKSRVQCRCARYEESVALPAPATLPPASESRVQRTCARYEESVAPTAPTSPLPGLDPAPSTPGRLRKSLAAALDDAMSEGDFEMAAILGQLLARHGT